MIFKCAIASLLIKPLEPLVRLRLVLLGFIFMSMMGCSSILKDDTVQDEMIFNSPEFETKILDVSTKKPVRIIIKDGLLFATDSFSLSDNSKIELLNFIDFLKNNGHLKLMIIGHSDDRGDYYYNQELSFKRALSINQFLRDSGVINETIVKSYGKLRPRCSNETDDEMQCNRRVELIIY